MRRTFVLAVLLAACGGAPEDGQPGAVQADALRVLSRDQPDSVDVISWNVEWFGSPTQGPTDDALQLQRAEDIIGGLNVDIFGLVEIVSISGFDQLLASLPHHHGVLASDPSVENGPRYYSRNEQKVALIVRDDYQIEHPHLILTDQSSSFGGRPPLEARLRFQLDGHARTLVVIVAHFKALTDRASYESRVRTAAALKSYLDATYPTQWVLVVGDFNDDLDVSTYHGAPSPFADLVQDTRHYRFITGPLSEAGVSTTVHFSATIDHHLATNELAAREVPGSAQVIRLDRFVPRYGDEVSDHYPVLSRYDLR